MQRARKLLSVEGVACYLYKGHLMISKEKIDKDGRQKRIHLSTGSGTEGANSLPDGEIREYFNRLRRRLPAGFLVAYLVPLMILSVYFHLQFNLTLKNSGKLHLTTLAESQRNTIDLFLQERVVNIFNLFHGLDFTISPSPDDMRRYLEHLSQMSDAFIDVGFFDADGVQVGYAGPYSYLQGKDYSRETWFQILMGKDRNYHISDIYLGFRRKPHFTIAVKQILAGRPYIMRATLDPDKFYLFLRTLSQGQGVVSSLVNREGRNQIVDPERGDLIGMSDYVPAEMLPPGANEIQTNGNTVLIAHAWLTEVPWSLLVRQPLGIAYAEMYRARKIMIISIILLMVMIGSAIWMITERLLRSAQATAESRIQLKAQLLHAAKLVSVGELAAGVAHEINNPLAIIASQAGVVRDMFNPEFGMDRSPEAIERELQVIDEAVFRTKDITQKLLRFSRKNKPKLIYYPINRVLEEVAEGLKEKELEVDNITLSRDYDENLPDVLMDPDQLRQVFLNFINNAQDAVEGPGTITLSIRREEGFVRAGVTDTGNGMTAEQMEKIFNPFFTTKEVGKGTGLGLSISLSIIQAMGGTIEVQSMPGQGSSFTVVLPIQESEETADGPD